MAPSDCSRVGAIPERSEAVYLYCLARGVGDPPAIEGPGVDGERLLNPIPFRDVVAVVSASGPVLRASGVEWDIRKVDPYSVYDRFDFIIPTGSTGDCYDRYRVRIQEMGQSLSIIEQAMAQLPAGPVRSEVPHLIRPPVGETYAHIEAPKGELGFYLVSDNSIAPYRCHIRAPSLINLTALREMIIGWKIQDAIIIFGSIDITMGEVDR